MKRVRIACLLGLLALALTSCTLYVTPGDVSVRGRVRFGISVSNIIRTFEPTRGAGTTYYVGENIAFRVVTSRDGYLTLTAIDPDGAVYTFARNIYVTGGRVHIIEGPNPSTVFSLVPPTGYHQVRASFTPTPTSGRIVYRGIYGEDQWTQTIRAELTPYEVRDIAQTSFYLR